MKALFFYQHFWPDSPPYANMLRTISSHFAQKGHKISVLTAQPSYKQVDRAARSPAFEQLDGVNVSRLALLPGSGSITQLRALSKALWPLRAACYLVGQAILGRRQEVIVAATIPPVANGVFGLIAARLTRAKFVYHLQDIYPEIGAVGGLWSEKSLKYKCLKWFDTLICKQADHCIVLSEDMAKTLKARGVVNTSITIINNFMLASFSEKTFETNSANAININLEKNLRVVFAGNLGRFQGLELMLQAFVDMTQNNNLQMELHFIGEGAAEQSLKDLADGSQYIFFHGHYPFEEACRLMATFDAGIVSIQPDIYRYAYPSKTLTYLGLGLPLLALVESESALAVSITNDRLGVAASNANRQALADGFSDLAKYLKSDANDRQRIKALAKETSSSAVVLRQWDSMFEKLMVNTGKAFNGDKHL